MVREDVPIVRELVAMPKLKQAAAVRAQQDEAARTGTASFSPTQVHIWLIFRFTFRFLSACALGAKSHPANWNLFPIAQ